MGWSINAEQIRVDGVGIYIYKTTFFYIYNCLGFNMILLGEKKNEKTLPAKIKMHFLLERTTLFSSFLFLFSFLFFSFLFFFVCFCFKDIWAIGCIFAELLQRQNQYFTVGKRHQN